VADPFAEPPTLAGFVVVDREGRPMTESPGDAGACVELALTREAAARAVADHAVEDEYADRLPLVVRPAELRILAGGDARHAARRRVFAGFVSCDAEGHIDTYDLPNGAAGFPVHLTAAGAAEHQRDVAVDLPANMMSARITVDLAADHAPDIPHDHHDPHADPTSDPDVLHAIAELRAAWSYATGSPTEGAKLAAALADLGEAWREEHDGHSDPTTD